MLIEDIWLAKDYFSGDNPAQLGILRGDLQPVIFNPNQKAQSLCNFCFMPSKYGRSWDIRDTPKADIIPLRDNIKIYSHSPEKKFDWKEYTDLIPDNDVVLLNFEQFNTFKLATKNLDDIAKRYKYAASAGGNRRERKKVKDLSLTIALYKLDMVCSIYNSTKVDGIGISVLMLDKSATKEYHKPAITFSTDLLLTNHTDNVISIDGAAIRTICAVSGTQISASLDGSVYKGSGNDKADKKEKFCMTGFSRAYSEKPKKPQWQHIDQADDCVTVSEVVDEEFLEVPSPSAPKKPRIGDVSHKSKRKNNNGGITISDHAADKARVDVEACMVRGNKFHTKIWDQTLAPVHPVYSNIDKACSMSVENPVDTSGTDVDDE